MKSKEELNKLKEEYTALNNRLKELSEEELKEVVGGAGMRDDNLVMNCGYTCPLCGQQHSFKWKFGQNVFDKFLISQNVCDKTDMLIMRYGSYVGVYDKNKVYYEVATTTIGYEFTD